MHKKDIAIVLDCGATNVRVIAINSTGEILAVHAMPNETDEDPHHKGGRIWDLEKLWGKLSLASKKVCAQINTNRIAGVTVTTFGVDGAFVDEQGALLYPVVSWQCERTKAIMANIEKYMPLKELYGISGVYPYAFNTINKMIWFKENRPDIIEKAHRFLFIPSLLINKLSGAIQNDATMMGTAMMADLGERKMSDTIFKAIGLEPDLFGDIAEPGDVAASISDSGTEDTGIPKGVPVFFAGHDTQFAIYGSGADLNQPVLSSGTWEILMTRSRSFTSTADELDKQLTTELDPVAGVYTIGQNWLGSGVLEWFTRHFCSELNGDDLYNTIINDASNVPAGAKGVQVDPAFYDDGSSKNAGTITGLTINTSRGQIYRAFLESLSFRLREGLEALQAAGHFKAESIICVGGGSKNKLWNQLRADVCNTAIRIIDQKETTVLGASMFVFAGAGLFSTIKEARNNIQYNPEIIYPSRDRNVYDDLYQNYLNIKK